MGEILQTLRGEKIKVFKLFFIAREGVMRNSAAEVECKNQIKTQEKCRLFAHACDARMCERWTGLSGAGLVG